MSESQLEQQYSDMQEIIERQDREIEKLQVEKLVGFIEKMIELYPEIKSVLLPDWKLAAKMRIRLINERTKG